MCVYVWYTCVQVRQPQDKYARSLSLHLTLQISVGTWSSLFFGEAAGQPAPGTHWGPHLQYEHTSVCGHARLLT